MVTQNMVCTHEGNKSFLKKRKIRNVSALDIIKCLKQVN